MNLSGYVRHVTLGCNCHTAPKLDMRLNLRMRRVSCVSLRTSGIQWFVDTRRRPCRVLDTRNNNHGVIVVTSSCELLSLLAKASRSTPGWPSATHQVRLCVAYDGPLGGVNWWAWGSAGPPNKVKKDYCQSGESVFDLTFTRMMWDAYYCRQLCTSISWDGSGFVAKLTLSLLKIDNVNITL